MSHAGAVISGSQGGAQDKIEVLRSAGVIVADSPALIGETLAEVMKG